MLRRTLLVGLGGLATGGCIDVRSADDEDPEGGDGGDPGLRDGDGGSGDDGAGDDGTDERFYESGTIEIVVDGEAVDLSADRFQAEHNPDHDIRFHLHEGDEQWHMEEQRVTFGQAIGLLPFFAYDRSEGAHVVTYDGETYDGGDPSTEIAFRVDGDAVDPTDHDVRDGEHLAVEITTAG